MDILSIGQMARLNRVSEKALRIYHKEGLLTPRYVDEQTGYRYYSLQQSATLDAILQMKEMGLSLSAIKDLLDRRDIDYLQGAVRGYVGEIDAQIARLQATRATAMHMLDQCELCKNKPGGDITVERLPARRKLMFNLLHDNLSARGDSAETALEAWERDLRFVKRQMLDRGLPPTLFHNIGCTISRENLRKRDLQFSGGFLFLDDAAPIEADGELPAGDFVCVHCDGMTAPDGSYIEDAALMAMLDYIDEHGYEIIGDYHGEVLAETPVFQYKDREMLVKLQIPVKL